MNLSLFNLTSLGNRFTLSFNYLSQIHRKIYVALAHYSDLRWALRRRKLALLVIFLTVAGWDGSCGGGVITPKRISAFESPNAPHVLQAEPAVSFFGAQGDPFWVVCHNDGAHRGDNAPDASGITCESQDRQREFSVRVVVTGFAPLATSNPLPSGDPTLAKDPVNPNVVWLAALMSWDTLNLGKRTSIGIAKLVRDPGSGAVTVSEPNPIISDAHRMVPIGGTNIEGTTNGENGPSPDRPFIAIDPTAENGNHAQYIAFFQNDKSFRDQNQVQRRRGRIMVTHRNSEHDRYWSEPVVVRAETVETDGDGWALDNDSYQFMAPQLVIRPRTHEIGIAFTRFQFTGDRDASVTLHNADFIGRPIFYFFGISGDRARTGWTARSVTSARAGSINSGPSTSRLTAAPYPVLAFDASHNRWVIVFPTSGTPRTPADTGKWELDSTFSRDGSTWSTPIQVNNSQRFPGNLPRNALFPSIAFDSQARRLTVGYLESNDQGGNTWRPVINFSSDGGDSWGPPHPLLDASTPRASQRGEYSWGGHWAGPSRAGFFGDYTGLANVGGRVFFAWTESRDSSSTPVRNVMDVWGAETTIDDP